MMNTKGELLKEEARKKFSTMWRGASFINKYIIVVFTFPAKQLRKLFPGMPHGKDLLHVIASFSLKRFILKTCLSLARKANNQDVASYFQGKLDAMEDVKTHVLTKYIIKELFLYFFISFLFFFMIFFVNHILLMAETILKQRVPFFSVIRLIIYNLPAVVAQAAPFATLVGFLMCLGRMVTDNEVLILRASGQGYIKILRPVILMGMLISIGSFVVNDYLLPLGTVNYNKLYRQVLLTNPSVALESNSVKRTKDQLLVIGNVKKQNVSDLVFFDNDTKGNQRIIVAQNSQINKSKETGVLMQLQMDNAFLMIFNKANKGNYDILSSNQMILNVYESSIIQDTTKVTPREMTSYDLLQEIKGMKKKPGTTKGLLNTYKLEYNKKFSIPFGSFFFALLALPLALVFGKKDGQTLGLIFGLVISVLYWAATILGQMFGLRSGYNGFVMMWAPNILMGTMGILLYFRLVRK